MSKQTRESNSRSNGDVSSEAIIEFIRSCSFWGESGGADS